MIKIPLNLIIERIKADSGITEEEINKRIATKMEQLSGLISKEGAAHIVANELGIRLLDNVTNKLTINSILVGMRDVETTGKVTNIFAVNSFNSNGRQGKVASFVMGDETGSIRIVLWNNQADHLEKIKLGDIIKVKNSYVKENRNGFKELHLNDKAILLINPEGETVGEVKSSKHTSNRKFINELQEDETAEVLGTIIQIYDLKFFETCPECNKRLKQDEGAYTCQIHGNMIPKYSYVLNVIADDGTDNIRIVCFRNQAEKLVNLTDDQIQLIKNDPMLMEPIKNDLLGLQVKFTGRVVKNAMFNRIELVCNFIDRNPNPEEEIKALEELMKKKEATEEEVTSIDDL